MASYGEKGGINVDDVTNLADMELVYHVVCDCGRETQSCVGLRKFSRKLYPVFPHCL